MRHHGSLKYSYSRNPFYHFRGCTQAQGPTYPVYFFTRLVSFKSHTPSACKVIGIMAILWWRSAPVSCRQLTFLGSMSLIQKAVYIPVIMNNNLHMTYKPDPYCTICIWHTNQTLLYFVTPQHPSPVHVAVGKKWRRWLVKNTSPLSPNVKLLTTWLPSFIWFPVCTQGYSYIKSSGLYCIPKKKYTVSIFITNLCSHGWG